jgi:formylglycine-generating enzyme required for sulfatase activity
LQAEDPLLKRQLALKVMLPALAAFESHRQRFLQEGQAAAAITHDHVVAIFQVGQANGVPFLAMPLLKGEGLEAAMKRRRLSVGEVLRIGREAAAGLAAAHAQGLIHRDIKPANIWLEALPEVDAGGQAAGFRVKILDFGLARSTGGERGLTQSGAVLGTPGYMAPEQASGQPVDSRCDLFSLGCVLYRLATGRPAFTGGDVLAALMAVATETPPPPAELNPDLPPGFSELIVQMLEKAPANRPASASAVAAALAALESVAPAEDGMRGAPRGAAEASRTVAGEQPTKGARQHAARQRGRKGRSSPPRGAIVAGVVGLALLVVAALILLWPGKEGRPGKADKAEAVLAAGKGALGSAAAGPEREVEAQPTPPAAPPAVMVKAPGPEIVNSIGMRLVRIPAGTFLMGSPEQEQERSPYEVRHEVEITRPFFLGVYEVTQKQYREVTGKNPSFFSAGGGGKGRVKEMDTDDFPVEDVSWDHAAQFCKKLSELPEEKKAGRKYRLPTEAEWEYACRAGSPSYQVFHLGNSLTAGQANFNGNFPYGAGGAAPLYRERTCKVGSYAPNAWGLFDMHGNVWEWCADWYMDHYYSKSPRIDPRGPPGGKDFCRVVRGGGFSARGEACRSARHRGIVYVRHHHDIGFRVALDAPGR